jgi:hypothetical protein
MCSWPGTLVRRCEGNSIRGFILPGLADVGGCEADVLGAACGMYSNL